MGGSPSLALATCQEALRRGIILLPSGSGGSVLSITPPLTIDEDVLLGALDVLTSVLHQVAATA